MDFSRIRPLGPWVLLRLSTPMLYEGPGGPLQKSSGGIFIPATAAQDKLGYCWATVIAVGSGKLSKKGNRIPPGVLPGETVWIRWYLSELNRPSKWDDQHCFLHQDDILVIRE
jgi:co-chaperonin GroES (HSP10)